jgi:hypothetical protein
MYDTSLPHLVVVLATVAVVVTVVVVLIVFVIGRLRGRRPR